MRKKQKISEEEKEREVHKFIQEKYP